MQAKDVETHQVFFLLSKQALLSTIYRSWPSSRLCWWPWDLVLMTRRRPSPLRWRWSFTQKTDLLEYKCWSWSFLAAQGLRPPTLWEWVELHLGDPLYRPGGQQARLCCATWLQISRDPDTGTISCTFAIGEPRIQVSGTLLTFLNCYFCAF